MSTNAISSTHRREFLSQLGVATAALIGSGSVAPLLAERANAPAAAPTWDMSWVDKIAKATYKVAFDANVIDDGIALDHAAMILDQFHDVYNTPDEQTAVVIVMRQLGTAMGFNDSLWARYPLKVKDAPDKPAPGKNPYWKIRPGVDATSSTQLERLIQRGVIVLVCNNATTNIARSMAHETGKNVDEVVDDFRHNLVPGAFLMPSGVFAMIRAQNAGCAFMRAS
jgi:intracellular sulfur oxidation DsrE/DsrF family protein